VGMFSHLDEVEMTKKMRKEHGLMDIEAEDMIDEKAGISRRDVQPFIYPYDEELEKVGVRGIYLGNYMRWDSKSQHEQMIDLYRYETAAQERTFNTYEDVDCFHSAGVHDYIKFLKYGYGKVSDHASREIRLKRMTREEGIEIVKTYQEHKPKDLSMFLQWLNMEEGEFFDCVNPCRDKRIWQNKNEKWILKDSVMNHINDEGVNDVRLEKIEECRFKITSSREQQVSENEYIIMGRSYIDYYNYQAIDDDQDEIQNRLAQIRKDIECKLQANETKTEDHAPLEADAVQYCVNCVMPNTKPGVFMNEEGVCSACQSVERKGSVDWEAREQDFRELCDCIRGSNGNGYDCLVPVSGGKDSQYQVWMMKNVHKMKVLAVCIVPHLQTREGIANLNSIVENYNVDLLKVSLKPSTFKAIRRKAFFDRGEPNWADHCSTLAGVTRAAYVYQIPLIVWGEDIAVEFGGTTSEQHTSSARQIIKSDLIKDKSIEYFYNDAVKSNNTFFYKYPTEEDWDRRKIQSVYLGYYYNWDGYQHYQSAQNYGFQSRKCGPLSGNVLDYDNIDEKLCEINIWFKFLKFGFWRPTDQCCYQIWNGRMSRDEAVPLVNDKQYEFPAEYLKDFLSIQFA